MTVELSPMGACRERSCPCLYCHRDTWNFSAVCDRCKADQRDADRFDEYERHDCDEVA